ncbi:protein containing Por secretion system C-terminal sorting domain [Lentimicrobium saccharophilum]|uniref:Protein containing Por secretion system C-terminal sorting domain n=1 Tax=Lentimicrobium saccharophilum TaxID=1678841 RepID=A0A0S7BSZ3_9BACT|nr:T9SS type A sorting domain-containing protein [Lentimicrobium saccharophilum]GAP43868.1 protein containing Por secretion system C-terminal sorting domain [Lentimicrobium saccharophilum]
MKKLLLLLAFVAIGHTSGFAQSCLPEGITFTTQAQIDNFQANYPGCTEIEGDVTISNNWSGNITNLNGLNALTSIGGALYIEGLQNLTSLSGLDNLTSIGEYLKIEWTGLSTLSGLESLTSIGGNLVINVNNSLVNLTGLDYVTSIGGTLDIRMNDSLANLTGLENLSSITGGLWLQWNSSLTSLTGLDNVSSIKNDVSIYGTNLINMIGLDNLSSIGGSLMIGGYEGGNLALTSLTGLEGLISIGGYLSISSSPLVSLMGLNNLNSIGDGLGISYTALTSLTGLDNIDAGSISDLIIIYNISLSNCAVQSMCEYLASPNGTIEIHNNAPGCNSPEEVEAACDEVSIKSKCFENDFLLFPNPAGKTVTISGNNATAIREIVIYNQTGQKVLQSKPVNYTLDISILRPGMYIVEMVTNHGNLRKKLIVQ